MLNAISAGVVIGEVDVVAGSKSINTEKHGKGIQKSFQSYALILPAAN